MQKETVTFDKLPEAAGYLTEQVIELKKMVSELQPPASDKHVLVEIEDTCRIIRKAKLPFIHWYAKGCFLPMRKEKTLFLRRRTSSMYCEWSKKNFRANIRRDACQYARRHPS